MEMEMKMRVMLTMRMVKVVTKRNFGNKKQNKR